jgi:hypothetical protein
VQTILKRRSWVAGAFLILIVVCSFTVHPFGKPKKADPDDPALLSDLKLPLQVAVVMKRSCMDCHSNQTVWPAYSYVAPVSWLVERDVQRGRNHFNLSDWPEYSLQKRQKLLADIASEVKNHEMPLPQYTLIHRHSNLSDADTDLLYDWARVERRRIKAILAVVPANADQHVNGQ